MPLHLTRRRTAEGPWYARGTVRIGTQKVVVAEFSTGQGSRAAALAAAAAEEKRIRDELLDGRAVHAAASMTIADAIIAYVERPGSIHAIDKLRLADLNERVGNVPVAHADRAWSSWLGARAGALKPATVARYRGVFRAALGHLAAQQGLTLPAIARVTQHRSANTRIAYLSREDADRLIAAYNPAAQSVALTLRYQGLRTQEALRLDWRQVDWRRRTLFIIAADASGRTRTKSRVGRTVAMHRRVRVMLFLLWRGRGRPDRGPVFLSTRGAPYRDTREAGGNPLKRAHTTACRRARISGFRVHDWRHHWASHLVMAGVDLRTLMQLGGWSSLRMVERYAQVSDLHMAAAIAKVA